MNDFNIKSYALGFIYGLLAFFIMSQSINAQERYLRMDYKSGTTYVDSIGKPSNKGIFKKQVKELKPKGDYQPSVLDAVLFFEKRGWKVYRIFDNSSMATFVVVWFVKKD